MRCEFKVLVGFLVIVIALISLVSAWEFNGTVYDPNGGALNNSLINVTIRNNQYQVVSSDSTYSNASGWFSLNVSDNSTWMYQPVIRYFNASTGAIEYVGQSLPAFDYMEMASGLSVDFYLKNAGTINITAVTRNGTPRTFNYQVKDQELGYPIEESFSTYVSEAVIYVPRDRNYSIMIHPNESMPVSYDWNNFSSSSSYSIDSLSSYNVTTHTLHKQFNTSTNLAWVSGNFLNSSGGSMGFDEIIIAPFLMEPGNMVYLGQHAVVVYNMSSWRSGNHSDTYVASSGTYNMTIPGTAESSTFMLFATGRNGTNYYGGYRNVSLSYSDTTALVNFTMYPLMSNDWCSANGNISMNRASDWSQVNASSAQQGFNLVNASSNVTLSQISAHIETIVDYSDYGALEMTFMMDIPQGGSGSFYLPLLNVTGIKEINVYSTAFAPRRIGTKTVSEILANPNISMAAFNPGDIDGTDISSNLYISLYKSNSTCDVPVPPSGCSVADSANMDNFNPLNAIIGGGDISFRMGLTSSGIEVHYAKVDLLASGPPDALFDDSATTSTSGGFSSAMRFGSNGPRIYDHVLVSIPYTQGSSSVAGLNESEDVDLSISLFYDENWNVIWNVTSDGVNATNLAGNYSHYSEHSGEWQTLMNGDTCVTSVASFNSANPCYIDTSNNRIWVRLPHFSGTSASISGGVTNVSSGDDDDDDDDSSSSSTTSTITGYWTTTYVADNSDFLNETGYTRQLNSKQRLRVVIGGVNHYVGIVSLTSSTATINISSDPQQAVFSVGQEKKFDVTSDGWYDIFIKLNEVSSTNANITIKYIHEEVPEEQEVTDDSGEETIESVDSQTEGPAEDKGDTGMLKQGDGVTLWFWLLIGIIVVLIVGVVGFWYYYFYRKLFKKRTVVSKKPIKPKQTPVSRKPALKK